MSFNLKKFIDLEKKFTGFEKSSLYLKRKVHELKNVHLREKIKGKGKEIEKEKKKNKTNR